MAEIKPARAPYNFVPFSKYVIRRYQTADQLPPHDKYDPSLLSGEIQVTATAETPIFVSSGGKHKENDFSEVQFSVDDKKRFIIPGATLRGMIRDNMQILGFGAVQPGRDIEKMHLLFRDIASTNKKEHYYYGTALGVETKKTEKGKSYSLATAVNGGYIHYEDEKYYILPVKEQVYHISRSNPVVSDWANEYAKRIPVWYQTAGEKVTAISETEADGFKPGVLLSPGWMKMQNHLYLFPEKDPDGARIELTEEEVFSYKKDLDYKGNFLKGTDKKHQMEPEFWDLPEDGESRCVFYIRFENFTSFGSSQFLRLSYRHALQDGLPEKHKISGETLCLDYPNAILGFSTEEDGYRSRVSIGDLAANGNPKPMEPFHIMLGSPKPSFTAAYVQGGKDYNQDDFTLSGHKVYWHHDVNRPKTVEKIKAAAAMRPLPEKTSFTGTIRFRNLHEDELGLLLWSLRLDEGCFQSIGMGKPYGFGRCVISIDSLTEYDYAKLYTNFLGTPEVQQNPADRVNELIESFDKAACKSLYLKPKNGKPAAIRNVAEIQDFLYLKRTIRDADEVSYMDLKEHRNVLPMEPISEIRAGKSDEVVKQPDDWSSMFAQRNARNAVTANPKKKVKW